MKLKNIYTSLLIRSTSTFQTMTPAKKFGFIADLKAFDNNDEKSKLILNGIETFFKSLSPKQQTVCSFHIICDSQKTDSDFIQIGSLDTHTFEDSSWLTDWYYFLPSYQINDWLNLSSMAGPGPIIRLSNLGYINEFPNSLVVSQQFESYSMHEQLSEILQILFSDAAARKILSKEAKQFFHETYQRLKKSEGLNKIANHSTL